MLEVADAGRDGFAIAGDGQLREIRTRNGDATVRALVSAGMPFTDLDVRPASLEDAVRHLTGGLR